MSHATRCKMQGIDWRKDYRVSEGCLSSRALRHFLEHHPDIKEIRAEEEKKNFEAQGYRVYIQTPTQKDFNKMLTSLYERPAVCIEEEAEEMER